MDGDGTKKRKTELSARQLRKRAQKQANDYLRDVEPDVSDSWLYENVDNDVASSDVPDAECCGDSAIAANDSDSVDS